MEATWLIPASYWRGIILAARRRGHPEVTAELLVDLHAREETSGVPVSRKRKAFGVPTNIAGPNKRETADKAAQHDASHFSRFKRSADHFRTAAEIEEHVDKLRDNGSIDERDARLSRHQRLYRSL